MTPEQRKALEHLLNDAFDAGWDSACSDGNPAAFTPGQSGQRALPRLRSRLNTILAMPDEPVGLPGEIKDALAKLPDGTWQTWTSCSFRRITRAETFCDGDVLHAVKHSDGHPDLSWGEEKCDALCTVVNGLRAMLKEESND